MTLSKKDRFIKPIPAEKQALAQATIEGVVDSAPASSYSDQLCHTMFGSTHSRIKKASVFGDRSRMAPPKPASPSYKYSLTCDRILDAPDLVNDYYLNLVSWGYPLIYIGLGKQLYFYNPDSRTHGLIPSESPERITALSASPAYVAKADVGGTLNMIDAQTLTSINTIPTDYVFSKIVSDSDNNFYLASRDSKVVACYDPRNNRFPLAFELSRPVLGIAYNSLSNVIGISTDSSIQLYDRRSTGTEPFMDFKGHRSPSKALAFFGRNKIASGGGSDDRSLMVWNTLAGQLYSKVDTGGQVCDIHWINENSVAVTGGYGACGVSLYQQKETGLSLDAREVLCERVLFSAQRPGSATKIATASLHENSPNEELRLWSIWSPTKAASKQKPSSLASIPQLR